MYFEKIRQFLALPYFVSHAPTAASAVVAGNSGICDLRAVRSPRILTIAMMIVPSWLSYIVPTSVRWHAAMARFLIDSAERDPKFDGDRCCHSQCQPLAGDEPAQRASD